MKNWNDIRTAAFVARLGTVSAAAEALGLHRATVVRHIDALEKQLGAKLFLRHPNGFTATPLAEELLNMADATEAHFNELALRANAQGKRLEGTLKITLVDDLAPLILPVIKSFQAANPGMKIEVVGSDQKLRLEYGEADIALRIGPKPQHPDNVVIPFVKIRMGLFAQQETDWPEDLNQLPDNCLVGPTIHAPESPYFEWLAASVPSRAVGFRSNRLPVLWAAVRSGLGAGFLPSLRAEEASLKQLVEPKEDWHEATWLVTHVDMHRTAKVQAFIQLAKSHSSGV